MRLHHVFVPLLTPMRADGTLELGAVRPHVDRLLAAGVRGLVALGTTGEFADLTAAERAEVIAAVVDAADRRVPVLAGVGAIGTAEAVEHARSAQRAGADGVLSLPPCYWKLDDEGLFAHYAAVAKATDLPVVLYDLPALAGTALSPALVERVARELPSAVGIKQSGPELRTVHAVLQRAKQHRPDFAVVVGGADLVLPALLAGADGTILALGNVAPGIVVDLVDAVGRADLDTAATHHRKLVALTRIAGLASPPILALKAAAAELGAPLEPHVRTPVAQAERVIEQASALAIDAATA